MKKGNNILFPLLEGPCSWGHGYAKRRFLNKAMLSE